MRRVYCALGAAAALLFATNTVVAGEVPGHGFGSSLTGYIVTAEHPPEVSLSFDGGSLTDGGRRGNDGVASGGVTFAAGVSGDAAIFDGTGRIIVGPADGSTFGTTGNHSVSVWVRIDSIEVDNQAIFTKCNINHPIGQADEDMDSLHVQNSGLVQTRRLEGGTIGVTPINDGQFHHVCYTFSENSETTINRAGDAFDGTIRSAREQVLYINGVEEGRNPDFRLHTLHNAEGPLSLGAGTEHDYTDPPVGSQGNGKNGNNHPGNQAAPGNPDRPDARYPTLVGALDEFQIIPGSLSAAQVQDLADLVPGNAANDSATITAFSVTPENGLAGTVNFSVTSSDPNAFVAVTFARQPAGGGAGLPANFLFEDSSYTDGQVGPVVGLTDGSVSLAAGTYSATAFAIADLRGLPSSDAGSMTVTGIVIGNLPQNTGPLTYETAGGAVIAVETELVSRYEDDDETSRGPVGVAGTPGENVNPAVLRGPYVFFQGEGETGTSFGGVYRRDGGFSRVDSGFLLRYDFDLDWSGGEEGTHIAWMRGLNGFNTSDFSVVTGDPDDQGYGLTWPFTKEGGFNNGDHRINEFNTAGPFPLFGAGRSPLFPCSIYGPTAADAALGKCVRLTPTDRNGHIKEFQDGENEISLTMRQAGPGRGKARTAWMDMWAYSTDYDHIPSHQDILGATALGAFVRGDCNGDGGIDISDGLRALGIAFLGDDPSGCLDACDFNASGGNDISNAVFFFSARFGGGAPIPKPQTCNFAAPLLGCEAGTCTDKPYQTLKPDGTFDFTPANNL